MKFNSNSVMKTHSSRRKDGFTLVELLVVITIIAVLAGAGFAAGNAAIQKAKKVTALATIVGIEQSVNAFYTEYNAMPKSDMNGADTTVNTITSDGKQLLNVLLAYKETEDPALNSRGIRFLSVKEGKAKKNGLMTSGDSPNQTADGLYDPWGGGYNVMLDGDYDETLKPDETGVKDQATLNGRRVAAWSGGADGVTPKQGKSADDVKNW